MSEETEPGSPRAAEELIEALRSGRLDGVAELLGIAANELVDRRQGISMRGIRGAPDWRGFEQALWEISEDLRSELRRVSSATGPSPVMDAVAGLVVDSRLAKGRQNFVLVLADFGGLSYADTIASVMDDDDVAAHALRALAKLGDDRHRDRAARLARTGSTAATRRSAARYLKRFERSS